MNDAPARDAPDAGARGSPCPRCGAPSHCGAGTDQCWCAALPALRALPTQFGARCLCERCLREALAREAAAPEPDRPAPGPAAGC